MATDTPTVLIVEDEPDLANLYTVWLGDEYETRTASNGTEALESIDESVDVVLLDRRMPELSGDTVLETIGERDLDCRVAMVTAVEPDFDIVSMGFDDYLVKPVSKDELVQAVERLEFRSTYDEELQQFFTLAEKKALLDAEKTDTQLVDSQAYAALEDRLAVSRVQLNETMTDVIARDDDRRLRRGDTADSDGESTDDDTGDNVDNNDHDDHDDHDDQDPGRAE